MGGYAMAQPGSIDKVNAGMQSSYNNLLKDRMGDSMEYGGQGFDPMRSV